ncbi:MULTISPECIES: zinc-binding dehydrogenase [unclassified Sphingopyxis]|uniref:zinc-binding dehydrogenase n=1 Tax=unclassified Sphingopyxis TaxID=2614943 RepID=UPI0007302C5A|nr:MULTISPECIES: zinc-binding dehydrogenase [unclassified Sphingopyxis]KTE24140.1 NADH oxidase [Sphingopyxis sp. H057]KTE50437.1 NADH oxidase [Sphingopyxis sp. H073]KTE52526.1 NADH oxidase [Sphingopyxis sp. H071]KTE63019.1 NADH oxidase [Sphingopyxis sp. H107]KTE64907.1 NADH oxidase [Sphingopyxis sp. H100]
MTDLPTTNTVMLTLVKPGGQLEVYFERRPMPEPKPHEVLVKVLATPINPSDLGLLFGGADMTTARAGERDGLPMITADVPPAGMRAMGGRIGDALAIGNEGCGVVVKAGDSPEAQALVGKTVALLGGEMYAEYRCLPVQMTMPLPDGTDPVDGASCFVNPLTSLAFTETMRMENHSAIVHTAAASNLGQMLVKICAKDGIPLVNIVRSDAQVDILKGIGAQHVVNSSADDFMDRLVDAIAETGATIGFDATGGGKLAGQILTAMEAAAVRKMTTYSRYGSDTFKQVYIYGALDLSPTTFSARSFGLTWGLGGFLLTPFMAKAGMETVGRMRKRVVDELTTTFKSHYSHEISLTDALDVDTAQAYNAKRTGEKYLIRP